MNQILISEKLYVTPDMRKKKKIFKWEFFLSLFLLCVLVTYAIYAEYDRNKSEEISQELLHEIKYNTGQETSSLESGVSEVLIRDDVQVITLNKIITEGDIYEEESIVKPVEENVPEDQVLVASDGTRYCTIGEIHIPSINVTYPILTAKNSANMDAILKISVCKFHGPNPNQIGNLCIVGHNYRNSLFFSKIPKLEIGAIVEITDLSGTTVQYSVYDKFIVNPNDLASTTQLTNGEKEITLITCTNDNKQRHIIKAKAI